MDGAGSTAPSIGDAAPTEGKSWVSSTAPIHGRLSATKDSIITSLVVDSELFVVALDPSTGIERWRRKSEVSARIPGISLRILTDDTAAYFLVRTGGPGSASNPAKAEPKSAGGYAGGAGIALTAADSLTGAIRWATVIDGPADPNARACAPDVCLFVTVDGHRQLWGFDPTSGSVQSKADVALPGGPGDDALIVAGGGGRGLSSFVQASRGPVIVGQFSSNGTLLDWAVPASSAFSGASVGPSGGFAGWSGVGGSWVIWMGPDERGTEPPKVGERIGNGAIAGLDHSGETLWLRTDRHPCVFAAATVPVVCDGDTTLVAEGQVSSKPSVIEGLDLKTGSTTWSVPLSTDFDEFKADEAVLRIGDDSFLVRGVAGLTKIDLRSGVSPSSDANAIGWCASGVGVRDDIRVGDTVHSYRRSDGQAPCRMGGRPEEAPPSLPIPDFAGVTVQGFSAWVVDGSIHGVRQQR